MSLTRDHEADIMAAAVRIMRKYRGGLAGTIADMEDTEARLRLPLVDDPPAVDDAATVAAA